MGNEKRRRRNSRRTMRKRKRRRMSKKKASRRTRKRREHEPSSPMAMLWAEAVISLQSQLILQTHDLQILIVRNSHTRYFMRTTLSTP